MTEKQVVRDVMSTEVTTLGRNDKLTIADDVMRLGRIRHLPVLDDDGAIAGVLSQRDMFRGALARTLGYGKFAQQRLMGTIFVKEVMSSDPVTVSPDASLEEAAKLLAHRKIGCLLVVEDDKLVGILTEGDFVRIFVDVAE